ncbi:MAG: Hsp20/alpha crystallin family protein [Candidatus Vogelbacteria bacterium]|nr:Hsp20/alpha crystallin family protein [Candidatus Vogelbacteria bacterium]
MSENSNDPKSVDYKEPALVDVGKKSDAAVPVRTDDFFSAMFDDFDRMFSGFFPLVELTQLRQATVRDDVDLIVATVPMPDNVKKENINIEVLGGYLYVDSRVERWEGEGEKRRLAGVEVLENTFALSSSVDASKAEAKFENGSLVVTLPKSGPWTKKVLIS